MKGCKRKIAVLLSLLLLLGGIFPNNGLTLAAKAATKTETVSLDITGGLTVGQTYMDGMVSVGTDMAYTSGNTTLTDVSGGDAGKATGYVTNGTNPDTSTGTGALIRFTPVQDGKVQVAGQLGSGKTFRIDTNDGTTVFSYENTSGDKMNTRFETVEVKAGQTYYIYAKGTKMRFYSLEYSYEKEDEAPTVTVEKTAELDITGGLTAGQTYMDGMVSVGTDMAYTSGNTTLTDVSGGDAGKATGYVTNGTNPDTSTGTGALIRFTPTQDGKIQVAGQLGSGKTFRIDTNDGTTVFSYENTSGDKMNTRFEAVQVEAGKTYYIYAKGTKMRFYSLAYKYEVETTGEQLPEIILPEGKYLAFEGAEGGGRYATGGRGGDVYVVTSLADDGSEGTLRYGIENAPAAGRIIVFNVGGTIYLNDTLKLADNITIAGQTAPGEGITIAGYDTNISDLDNVIVRFVHFRPGTAGLADGGDSIDALWGRDMSNFMIDHCSFSWNTDECLSTYRGQNGTVQWSIISESLTVSGHSKGRHGYGGIWGSDNTVFQYNLIANHTSRNPRIGGGSMTDPTSVESYATVQLNNNVTYDYGYYACYGGGYAYTNYINNYLKTGPGTRDSLQNSLIDYGEDSKTGGVYISGNVVESKNGKLTDNTKGVTITKNEKGGTTTWSKEAYTAESFDSVTLRSAEEAYDLVLNGAGVTYPKRDAIDARVIQQVEENTGFFINTQDEVGGYCAPEAYRSESFDTDMDGIPDEWESAHGLNPNDKLDSRTLNDAGYAWIEVYFNELVQDVVKADYAAKNPNVSIDLANNTIVNEGTAVTVTASATAKNGGSIDRVEFYNGGKKVGEATSAPYSYTYSGLKDGTYDISVRAYDNQENATQSNTAKLHVNATAGTGEEWSVTDIGNPAIKSTASYIDGVMTVKGAGKVGRCEGSVFGTAYADATKDNYAYVYKKFTGDMELVTRLDSYIVVDNHTYNGLMFRESLDANAASVGVGFSMSKIVEDSTIWTAFMVNRETTGAAMPSISETIDSPSAAEKAGIPFVYGLDFKDLDTYYGIWLKLARDGDTFIGYVSQDGVAWQTIGEITMDMPDELYIGFAVDAGKAANDIENYATAKFSNIQINTDFANISYDVDKLDVNGVERIAAGEDVVIKLIAGTGYLLPETVEVTKDGVAIPHTYDAENGTISLENVTGNIVVKASAVKRKVVKVKFEEVDIENNMTVEEKDGVITLTHTGLDGKIAKNTSTATTGMGYILFPETDKAYTMSMKMTIKEKLDTKSPKETGVFVGIFDIPGNAFSTLGFRHDDGKATAEELAGYWTKASGSAGNGSPKLGWSENVEYTINFTSNGSSGFLVEWEAADGSCSPSSKNFKINECTLAEGNTIRYGIGVIGATVEILDLKLMDHEGFEVYPGSSVLPDSTDAKTEDVIENAVTNATSAEEALEVILGYTDERELLELVEKDAAVAEMLTKLEAEYIKEKGIDVSVVVENEAKDLLASEVAEIKYAALNVDKGVVKLVIGKTDKAVSVDNAKYPQEMKVSMDIKLVNGENKSLSLKVPVTITMSVPKNMKLNENLKLLHFAEDGSFEEVKYTLNGDKITFTVNHFSTFMFVGEKAVDNAENTPTPTPGNDSKDDNNTDSDSKDDNKNDNKDEDSTDSKDDNASDSADEKSSDGLWKKIRSPKTFFEEGSLIHSILWPNTDAENGEENAKGVDTNGNVTMAAAVAAQETVQNGNGWIALVVFAILAVAGGAFGILWYRKNKEEF
ncbi:MAG: hypothetical protein J6A94_03335 [Lachnospiraceae bacterium]|nr:hypothetical protein [Lachnospiraceae bacterium]